MNFIIYSFFFVVLLMPIFICIVQFENHGQKCTKKLAQDCGFNCKCNKSLLCECTKPKNAGEIQFCYDNIPPLPHGITTCHKIQKTLECNFTCPEGRIPNSEDFSDDHNTYDSPVYSDFCSSETHNWKWIEIQCYHNDCNDKIKIKNVVEKCKKSVENKKICTLSCKKRLTLVGNNKMTCTKPISSESGWTGEKPMCLNSACVDLMVKKVSIDNTELPNCTVSENDNSVICYITCKKGYRIEGHGVIYCFHKKNEFPKCFDKPRKCKHLKKGDVISNKRIVQCKTDKDGFQNFCEYECTGFHHFRGSSARKTKWATCMFSVGEWRFSECILQPYMCESLKVGGVKAKCSLGVRAIKNKTWNCDLECNEGFTEEENPCKYNKLCVDSTDRHLTCTYGNKWSGNPIKCLKNFGCKIENHPHTTYSCTKKFEDDYQCTVICDEGYHAFEDGIMICLENSKWDSEEFCLKNYDCITPSGLVPDCPPKQDFDNSPWKCALNCPHNKHMVIGTKYNYCLKNSTWAYTTPVCY